MRMPNLILCFPLLLILSQPVWGQGENGFLRGQGKGDLVLTYSTDRYKSDFDRDVNFNLVSGTSRVDFQTFTVYGSYGVTDDLDLSFNGSYVESDGDGAGGFPDEEDIQDVVIRAKWRLHEQGLGRGTFTFLAAPGIKYPLGDYRDNGPTALGDGQTDLYARVIGHYHDNSGLYAALETGYDNRNGSPKDEFPVKLTVGYTFWNRFTLTPFYTYTTNTGSDKMTKYGVSGYLRLLDHVGLSGSYRITDWPHADDVPGWSVGVVFSF